MNKMYNYIFPIVVAFFYSCNAKQECGSANLNKINKTDFVTVGKLRERCAIEVSERDKFSCLMYRGEELAVIPLGNTNDEFSFKLEDREMRFSTTDSLQAVFFDDRAEMRLAGLGTYIVNLKLNGGKTPACDSVYRLFYEGVGGNINKLTRETEKVNVVKLYDETVHRNIVDYINSLTNAERNSMDSCTEDFFLRDMLDTTHKNLYGYAVNEYELKDGIKDYLNALIQSLKLVMSEREWKQQQMILTIDGYADEQLWPASASKTIEKRLMGTDTANIKNIYDCNCTPGRYVDYDAPDAGLPVLANITSNCRLSIARAFTAATYLRQQLMKRHINAIIMYRGGDVSPGKDVDRHRKVDVFMQFKAVDSSPAPIQQQVVPATKD